jgi:ankyrin repeat protein/cell wall assembly regulator SMI1
MQNPIRRSARPVTEAEVALFERRLGLSLPAEYRAFLLAHNGGVPRRTTFAHVSDQGRRRDTWLRRLYSLGRDGLIDPGVPDLEAAYRDRPRGLPAGVIPVGDAYFLGNEGCVCLAWDGPDAGKVFFRPRVEPDRTTLYAVADSWDRFLTTLRHEGGKPVPWKEAIQDGDTAALRQWLGQHQKHWQQDRSLSLDVERTAVEEDQWPAVEVLMDHGFDPSSLFEEALSYHRYDLALRLLRTGKVGKRTVRECLCRGGPYLWYLPPLLEELVAAGADVNHETDSGDTPLHAAVDARSAEGVRFLIRHGADPTVKNDDGRTPLGLARRLEEPKLAEVLREAEEAWRQRPVEEGPAVVELDWHGVEMTAAGPPLTLADVQAFEQQIGLTFPPEYRALLLRANGGTPRPNVLPAPAGDEGGGEVRVEFLPLRRGQQRPRRVEPLGYSVPGETVEGAREWYHDGTEIPRGKVPIGWLDNWRHEGAWLLLGCKGRDRGKLFACFYGTESLRLTLPGLFELLGRSKAAPDSPGERLRAALAAKDLAGVRAALAGGARALLTTAARKPLLERACEVGFDDGALALVEAGARASDLLRTAVLHGRFGLVRRLLRGRKAPSPRLLAEVLPSNPALFGEADLLRDLASRGVDFRRLLGDHPHLLAVAAGSGSVDGLRFMLEQGGDPHARDYQGGTLLHQAATAPGGDAVVRYLLGLGGQPNQPDCQGHTALHLAAAAGNLEAARALIDAGEDLHARHGRYVPGQSAEETARRMEQVREMLGGGLAGLLQGFGVDDEDGPPPPDTSTPLGEKLAELRDVLEQKKKMLAERLAGGLPAGLGQGVSAAEMAAQTPEGRAILPELEAHAARRRPPGS